MSSNRFHITAESVFLPVPRVSFLMSKNTTALERLVVILGVNSKFNIRNSFIDFFLP